MKQPVKFVWFTCRFLQLIDTNFMVMVCRFLFLVIYLCWVSYEIFTNFFVLIFCFIWNVFLVVLKDEQDSVFFIWKHVLLYQIKQFGTVRVDGRLAGVEVFTWVRTVVWLVHGVIFLRWVSFEKLLNFLSFFIWNIIVFELLRDEQHSDSAWFFHMKQCKWIED